MTEILILLVGIFAFIALAQTLHVQELQRKLLKAAEEIQELEDEVEHWTVSWEEMNDLYDMLSKKHEPEMWVGSDTSVGDTDMFKIVGCDSVPPEDWDNG